MGDDWADEEVPMDNIEQVFIELSCMPRNEILETWMIFDIC